MPRVIKITLNFKKNQTYPVAKGIRKNQESVWYGVGEL